MRQPGAERKNRSRAFRLRRMGRKNVRTDDPTERLDTKILETVVELDDSQGLVPGLRVTGYIGAPEPPAAKPRDEGASQ